MKDTELEKLAVELRDLSSRMGGVGRARVGEAGGAAELGEAQLQAPLLVQRPREGVLRAAGPGALRMFET